MTQHGTVEDSTASSAVALSADLGRAFAVYRAVQQRHVTCIDRSVSLDQRQFCSEINGANQKIEIFTRGDLQYFRPCGGCQSYMICTVKRKELQREIAGIFVQLQHAADRGPLAIWTNLYFLAVYIYFDEYQASSVNKNSISYFEQLSNTQAQVRYKAFPRNLFSRPSGRLTKISLNGRLIVSSSLFWSVLVCFSVLQSALVPFSMF